MARICGTTDCNRDLLPLSQSAALSSTESPGTLILVVTEIILNSCKFVILFRNCCSAAVTFKCCFSHIHWELVCATCIDSVLVEDLLLLIPEFVPRLTKFAFNFIPLGCFECVRCLCNVVSLSPIYFLSNVIVTNARKTLS